MDSILDLAIAISIADFASDGIGKIIGQFKLLEGASKETLKQMEKYKNIAFGGTALAAAGVAGFKTVSGAIEATAEEAMKFEDVMNDVKIAAFGKDLIDPAKSKEVKRTLDDLTEGFEKLGVATKFSDQGVAEAGHGMLKGGLTKEDLLGSKDKNGKYNYSGLTAAMYAAQLGEISPSQSGDFMAKMKAAYNLSGDGMEEATNYFVKTAAASTMDMKDIVSGMQTASGVSGQLRMSPQDTALLLASTGTYTRDGSSAGTYTKDFLDRLIPKSKKQIETMDTLGWLKGNGQSIFFNDDGSIKSADFIAKVMKDTKKNFKADEFQSMLHKVFLEQGKVTALALATESDVYGSIKGNIGNQLDMYQQVEIQMGGTLNLMESMMETWNIIKRVFGEPFLDPIKGGLKLLNAFLGDSIVQWGKTHPNIIKTVGILGLVVTGLMTVTGAGMILYGAFGALNLALATAGLTLGGVVMTSIWAIGIFAGVVAVGYLIYKNWDSVTSMWEKYGWVVKLVGSLLLAAYTPAILVATASMIKLAAVTGWSTIKTVALYVAHGIGAVVMGGFRSVMLAVAAAQWIYGMATGTATASTVLQHAAAILLAPTILMIRGATLLWAGAQTALSAAMSANPVGVVIAIIGVLIGVVFLAVKYWDVWTGKLKSFANSIPDWGLVVLSVFAPIVGIPLTLIKYWDKAIAKVKEFFNVKDNKGKGDLNKTVENTEPVKIPTILDHKGFFQQMQDMKSKKDQMPTFDIPANADFTKFEEQLMNFNLGQDIESLNLPTDLDFSKVSEQLEAFNLGKSNIEGLDIPVDLDTKALLEQTTGLEKTMNLTGNNATLQLAQGMSSGQSISEVTASSKAINSAFKKQLPKDSEMKKYGANLGSSLAKGISSKQSEVKKAAENMAKTINDYLGVKSPTKEGPLQTNHLWGSNLMKSIANGMMGDLGLVKHAADSVASAMNVKGGYQLDSPTSGIRVKHPSESSRFIVQGPLVSIEKIEQQPGEDSEKFAKRVAKLVKQEIDTEKKRNRLTTSNELLTT